MYIVVVEKFQERNFSLGAHRFTNIYTAIESARLSYSSLEEDNRQFFHIFVIGTSRRSHVFNCDVLWDSIEEEQKKCLSTEL